MHKSVAILIVVAALSASAATKLDPALSTSLAAPSKSISSAISKSFHTKSVDGEKLIDCLVRTTDSKTVNAFIADNGGTVRSTIGEIMTAWVPSDVVADLSELPQVVYVEASKRLRLKLGDVNPTFNASNDRIVTITDVVQDGSGSGLSGVAYTGTGVIVGVVDSGIDCTNTDFNDSSGNTRILSYWDQSLSGDGVPSVIVGAGGTEYNTAQIQAGDCTASPDTEGHGTHVTGIAASQNATYTGMAPTASIISVKLPATDASSGGSFSSSVIDGVNYIFRKAQVIKVPAVVNLSLGTSLGAHDNTSLLEQGLNTLVSGVQGRAIVNAEGNENLPSTATNFATDGGIHALVSATSGSPVAYEMNVISGTSSYIYENYGGIMMDVWLASGGTCSVGLNAFAGTQKTTAAIVVTPAAPGGSTSGSDSNLSISVNFTDNQNANNGKQQALVTITPVSSSKAGTLDNYTYDLIFSGTCSGHAWLYPDQTGLVDFSKDLNGTTNSTYSYTYGAGDSNYTTTIPATASGVIAVGSFMGRQYWTNINGDTMDNLGDSSSTNCATGYSGTVSDISLFSSLGPTADGRTKPDITAPGEPIVSTLSADASESTVCKADSTHFADFGTSMSSPGVAGIVALMLQRNGCLTPTEIKTLLTQNPTTDSFTGSSLPNDIWGSGKVNALAAVVATTAATCAPDNVSEDGPGVSAYTTSSTSSGASSGGCSLIRK